MTKTSITQAAVAAIALATATVLWAEGPTTAPATQPAVAVDAKTAAETALKADLAAFRTVFTGPQILTDAAARKAAAPTALPAMAKVYADFGALAAADPEAKEEADGARTQFTAMMAVFGDADANGRLAAQANDKDPTVALAGKGQQLLVQWWSTAQDPAAQAKVADQVEVLGKAHPESAPLTDNLVAMSQMGAASPELTTRVQTLITGTMKNEVADQAKAEIASAQKLAALSDKPMVIAGKNVDGKDFTTADWKGKVILVDFWATWCAPCRAELPRVQKIYAENHDKGLEILGVSNDQSVDDLKKFLGENPKMPWPQLFDATAAAQQQWNPITQGYGINGIPTMFLIDKKGVCRTVDARENMEQMIPKLLAE